MHCNEFLNFSCYVELEGENRNYSSKTELSMYLQLGLHPSKKGDIFAPEGPFGYFPDDRPKFAELRAHRRARRSRVFVMEDRISISG